jgi:poly(hydroxyalkanoate) depolymerase family esterase
VKTNFLRKILAAGVLTRGGRVAEATAAIQRALGAAGLIREPAVVAPAANDSSASAAIEAAVVDASTIGARVVEVHERAPAVVESPVVKRPREASFIESSFTGAAGTRAFKLFEPAGNADLPRPLVVMLHGCTQDPDDFAAGTRMNELAQAEGFLVLYPAQAPRSNAHKCWNWFTPGDQHRGAGEPALLAGMVRHVMQTHRVDGARVYVAGLSAGGAMAAILAREYPDLFAAAGVHSGVPAGAAHDVASAFAVMKSGSTGPSLQSTFAASTALWGGAAAAAAANEATPSSSAPVIVFHGDADATVAPANGDAVVAAVLAQDPSAVRVDLDGPAGPDARAFRRTVWRAADAGATAPSLAEQWVVRGAPHAWSGGAAAGSYTDPRGPDASREMLRFFREHPRTSTID